MLFDGIKICKNGHRFVDIGHGCRHCYHVQMSTFFDSRDPSDDCVTWAVTKLDKEEGKVKVSQCHH